MAVVLLMIVQLHVFSYHSLALYLSARRTKIFEVPCKNMVETLGYQRKAGQKGTDYYPAKELRC